MQIKNEDTSSFIWWSGKRHFKLLFQINFFSQQKKLSYALWIFLCRRLIFRSLKTSIKRESFCPCLFQAAQNVSSHSWSGNPHDYTIGGVLSGAPEIEQYFRQVLSVSGFSNISPWFRFIQRLEEYFLGHKLPCSCFINRQIRSLWRF